MMAAQTVSAYVQSTSSMLPRPAVITAVQPESPGVATYTLEFKDSAWRSHYRFQPGQFNMLYVPGIGEVAISVSSDSEAPETLLHTVRMAGNVTQAIARLKPGDVLGLRGPYGTTWPVQRARGRDLIFVAGGIGLAPLRPAIYYAMRHRADYGKVTVLVGARNPADLLYPGEYDSWRGHDVEVNVTVDRADDTWHGRVGVVPMLFYSLRPDPKRTTVLACGPEIMMRFVIYEALARRIGKECIYVSLERNMKCGVGYCGHCQFGPVFLCKEGPVFTYAQIEPFFGVEEF